MRCAEIGFCSSGRLVALRNFAAQFERVIDNVVLMAARPGKRVQKTEVGLAVTVEIGGENPQD